MRIAQIILYITFLTFAFQSCNEDIQYNIPEDTMIDILVDIHISDGVLNTESFSYEDMRTRPENYYKNILDKYQINRLEFDSALIQYTQDRIYFLAMYDKVIEKLREKESYIKAEQDKNIKQIKGEKYFYSFDTGYENKIGLKKHIQKGLTSEESYTGKYSYKISGKKESELYRELLVNPVEEVRFELHAFVKVYEFKKKYPYITFVIKNDKELLAKRTISIKEFIKKKDKWNEIKMSVNLSLTTPKSKVEVSCFFHNPDKLIFFVDDYSIQFKQLK